MLESAVIISVLLVILCSLAGLDLWRQLSIKSGEFWYSHYMEAVKSKYDFWKVGYRLEELELKLDNQKKYFQNVREALNSLAPKFRFDKNTLRQNYHSIVNTRNSRIVMHNLVSNDTEVFQIRCEFDGPYLRIGVNDYRTDARDVCQIFTSPAMPGEVDYSGPLTMFLLDPIKDGSFSLKSLANEKYVKAVPPPPDNPTAPWKLVVGSATVGAAETFRITDNRYLYSSLMGKKKMYCFFSLFERLLLKSYYMAYLIFNFL